MLSFRSNQYLQKLCLQRREHLQQLHYDSREGVLWYPILCKGFKIDLRFLIDQRGKEYDLEAGEIARNDSKDMLVGDEGKLAREAEDVLDHLLWSLWVYASNMSLKEGYSPPRTVSNDQLIATHVEVSTVHLIANGVMSPFPSSRLIFLLQQ